MRLIRKIEINYLRSLYRAILDQPGDMNVVFGRNDSGKSNVLRALNLFFNGETETNREVDFAIDFSDIRREEARTVKGKQFISIRVDFDVPANYQKSLGKQVSVKRQWNINGDMTETPPRGMTTGQRIQLSKFLNRINFTYVPAIKDAEVFGDLIERMYEATAETIGFQSATNSFVESIRVETSTLSQSLTTLFKSNTQLAAPTEMGLLFRSLDFSHGESGHSLLRQKGDGVKARHIPELLRYINENEKGSSYFIWGFEEPENSLDFASAEAETKTFSRISSRTDTQVFITSHSPAFYLAEPESKRQIVRRYFVNKQSINNENSKIEPTSAIDNIDSLDNAEKKMAEASLLQLPYIIRQWKDLKDRNTRLEELQNKLSAEIKLSKAPILYVEGLHDQKLFDWAFKQIGLQNAFPIIKTLGGTPKDTSELLKSLIEVGGAILNCPTLFLFDNDKAGRMAYSNLCKDRRPESEPKQISANLLVWTIPCSIEVSEFCNNYKISEDNLFFVAEFIFGGKEAAELCKDLMSEEDLKSSTFVIDDSYHRGLPQKLAAPLRSAIAGSPEWFWARGVPDGLKSRYFESAKKKLDPEPVLSVARTIARSLGLS